MSIDTNTAEITLVVGSTISFFISYIGLWKTSDCTRSSSQDTTQKWSHVFFLIWLLIMVLLLATFYILIKWVGLNNNNVNTAFLSLGIVIPIVMIIIIYGRTRYLARKQS